VAAREGLPRIERLDDGARVILQELERAVPAAAETAAARAASNGTEEELRRA